ncbi:MAG: hypothetical protein GX804_00075 [Lentisphaerae bacterium]|nr:hypothetical protein [Lentisphaerota bacterium]
MKRGNKKGRDGSPQPSAGLYGVMKETKKVGMALRSRPQGYTARSESVALPWRHEKRRQDGGKV